MLNMEPIADITATLLLDFLEVSPIYKGWTIDRNVIVNMILASPDLYVIIEEKRFMCRTVRLQVSVLVKVA